MRITRQSLKTGRSLFTTPSRRLTSSRLLTPSAHLSLSRSAGKTLFFNPAFCALAPLLIPFQFRGLSFLHREMTVLHHVSPETATVGAGHTGAASATSSSTPAFHSPSVKHVTEAIRKPDIDDRHYRHLTLKSGLEALVISDPTTDKAAAAMDVHIGHFSDPEEFPGLAHFLEHMLFMGSETFPDENAYSKYLAENGGHSNAYTGSENTNYYFDVKWDCFEEALDRFAPFFICPTFDPSSTDREMQAVDSENKKNLQEDMWRLYQLSKTTSNPKHPFHKFGTGNLETLGTIPKSKGLDTRKALLKFHADHYSANIMRLVLIGRESLDQLSHYVVQKFDKIAAKNVQVPKWEGHPLEKEQLGRVTFSKPIKDLRQLEITWRLPDLFPFDHVKPGEYLSHLLGHESTGSLLSKLKEEGLVIELSAGSHHIGEGSNFFECNMQLTQEGTAKWQDVVVRVFEYLAAVVKGKSGHDGIAEWIFNEAKALAEINFRFAPKRSPSGYASSLASQMQKYAHVNGTEGKIVSGAYIAERYDENVLKEIAAMLNWANCAIRFTSPDLPAEGMQKEKWYGTEHKIEPFSGELVKRLSAIDPLSPSTGFALPQRNDFVPQRFDVPKEKAEKPALPKLIGANDAHRFFYKRDDTFLTPKATTFFIVKTPLIYSSPRDAAAAEMYVRCVLDELTEYGYNAELAGLHYSVEYTAEGIALGVSGFNDKQHVLLAKIVEKLKTIQLREDRFAILKDQLLRDWKNARMNAPYQHARYYMTHMTQEVLWMRDEKIAALTPLTTADLQAHIPKLLQSVFIEGLVVGNMDSKEATGLLQSLERTLHASSVASNECRTMRTWLPPKGTKLVYAVDVFDKDNVNSALDYFVPTGSDLSATDRSLAVLLAQILQEPCFDTLRTKEQLGYIVHLGLHKSTGCIGVKMVMQSERPALYLEARAENFLKEARSILANMTAEEYKKHQDTAKAHYLEKDKNLDAEFTRYWNQINAGTYDFDRVRRDAELFHTIDKQALMDYFDTFFNTDSPDFTKISVHMNAQVPYNSTDTTAAAQMDAIRQRNTIVTDIKAARADWHLSERPKAAIPLTM